MNQSDEPRLKVVSINIERSEHLSLVFSFLEKEKPDVLCLQEVMQSDLALFEDFFGTKIVFVPMTILEEEVLGVAIISIFPTATFSVQYAGNRDKTLPSLNTETYEEVYATEKFYLLVARVKAFEKEFTIATTHAPVTEMAQVTDYQIQSMKNLITELDNLGDFVLFGDLNAPRGLEPFTMLAERYQDNIPPHYTSSIDPVLHRAAPIEKMVDGCFSSQDYKVENVRLESGVSDHCAIYAEIIK